MTTTKTSGTLSPTMLANIIAFRKGQLRSLELIEDCMEQDIPLPQAVDLGSSIGNDWQLWIVEIPDALINSLTEYVIPALEAFRLKKGTTADPYRPLGDFIPCAAGVVDRCRKQKPTVAKVHRLRPSKQSQDDAVASAQSLLRDMLMLLEDLHHVAAHSEEWACAPALRKA